MLALGLSFSPEMDICYGLLNICFHCSLFLKWKEVMSVQFKTKSPVFINTIITKSRGYDLMIKIIKKTIKKHFQIQPNVTWLIKKNIFLSICCNSTNRKNLHNTEMNHLSSNIYTVIISTFQIVKKKQLFIKVKCISLIAMSYYTDLCNITD